jgi:hypothetical protein
MSEGLESSPMVSKNKSIPNGKEKVVDNVFKDVLWEDPEV